MDFRKEENNLYLQELIFEVTRKCNLECIHCFCGEPENLDLSNEIIDKVLDQVRWVKNISLTGGEPMLVPQIVEYIVDEIIKKRIKLLAFNCVVNGTIMDERAISFMQSFNKIAIYINEHYRNDWGQDYSHDIARLVVSVDEYHKNNPDDAVEFYKKYANDLVRIIRQDELVELNEIRSNLKEKNLPYIDNSGRAEKNNIGYKRCHCRTTYDCNLECCSICHRLEIDTNNNNMIKCPLVICANGNVTLVGQVSYAYRDKYSMGNVLKKSLVDMISNWQWSEPLLCKEVYELMNMETIIDFPKCPESIKSVYELAKNFIMMKKEFIKRAHEMYPNLPYEDIVKGVNAELNIHTEGNFTKILSQVLPEYYDKNYVYNRAKEQDICDRLMYGKGYDIVKTLRSLFGVK